MKLILRFEYNGKLEPHDPWAINYHHYGCENSIWAPDGESLIAGRDLKTSQRGRPCPACRHEHDLWSRLLGLGEDDPDHPPTWYGDLAYRGLNLQARITDGYSKIEEMDAFDADLMKACRGARAHFEVWLSIEKAKKMSEEAKS